MSTRLPSSQVKALFEAFAKSPGAYAERISGVEADFAWAQSLPVEKLRSPEGQDELWKRNSLGWAGHTKNYDLSPFYTETKTIELLVSFRDRGFSALPTPRAGELQALYQELFQSYADSLPGKDYTRFRVMRALHLLRPGDFMAALSPTATKLVRSLLIGNQDNSKITINVFCRARLREVLGQESNLHQHAERSVFTLALAEYAEAIQRGETPDFGAPMGGEEPAPQPPKRRLSDLPMPVSRLTIDPFELQHQTLGVYRGGLNTLRHMLRESLTPQTPEALRDSLDAELADLDVTMRYTNELMRDLLRLGLLERKSGDVLTTELGKKVLGDDVLAVLSKLLVRSLRGFAHTLRHLAEYGESRKADITPLLESFTPPKSLMFAAQCRVWWGITCELIYKPTSMTYALTPRGEAIVARLPAELPEQTLSSTASDEELGHTDELEEPLAVEPVPEPTFPQLAEAFHARCKAEGLTFTTSQLLSLHTAWHFADRHSSASTVAKRFAVLSGLSGTGKTQLLKQYALTVCALMDLPEEQHIAQVAVRPDWRDPTGLLGYLNALHATPHFHIEPALELVLHANKHPHLPHFLLLDEMNLARVERYFAPFLSSMENGADLHLHSNDRPVSGVPKRVPWPNNLRIGGSVNMDETTHPFSDKVLDRAFTMEFWSVDLERFFAGRTHRVPGDATVEALLLDLQKPLESIRRHFGYRTAGEVLDWVAAARESGAQGVSEAELLDQAVFSKVLPRLRGTDTPSFRKALTALITLCESRKLTSCASKLHTMQERLQHTGVTGFWA